jgi:hypothetical protein
MQRQEFQSDLSIELGILREIHFSHPTSADLLDDPVVPDNGVVRQLKVRSGDVV